MSSQPGYKVRRLQKLLQKSFPKTGSGLPIIWKLDDIHVVTGAWRTNVNLDVQRWNAYAVYVDESGKEMGVALDVGSYTTITELIKYPWLTLGSGNEVHGSETPP